jgi:hypothetical protein
MTCSWPGALPTCSAELLQALVHQRYKLRRSIVITSNRVVQDWGKYLGDATMATTILDRLMHRCAMLEFEGKSYRLKEAAARLIITSDPVIIPRPAWSSLTGHKWSSLGWPSGACNEASAARETPAPTWICAIDSYWAWLVRQFGLQPDHNQRRRVTKWLREVARDQEQFAESDDQPAWALWLQTIPWGEVAGVRVVPLLSPSALLQESIALHNCADGFATECSRGSVILLSLREQTTDRRVALACLERRGNTWIMNQVAGPCNKPAPDWLHRSAAHAGDLVRRYFSPLAQS